MSEQTFQHGDACCGCNCTDGPIGTGGCLLTYCCPCIAFCQAAENSKVDGMGWGYLVFGLLGFNCCSLMALSMHVEEKRGLKQHGVGWHCCHSCFDGCSCHSCRVVNECKIYEDEGALTAAPEATEMVRTE